MIRFTFRNRHHLSMVLLVGAMATAGTSVAQGGGASRSIKAGVYTEAQANRGMALYIRNCSSCHGEMYNGGESGPTLSGSFLDKWSGKTVADLYEKIRTTMPPLPDTPGKVGEQGNIDIIASILSMNELPTGQQELTAKPDELKAIMIE